MTIIKKGEQIGTNKTKDQFIYEKRSNPNVCTNNGKNIGISI